jgi:hypothetical protein
MSSPGRFLDVVIVGLEVKPKSLWPKPVLKLFMKDFRLGMVADAREKQSEALARMSAGTKVRPGRTVVEVREIIIAWAMDSAATLFAGQSAKSIITRPTMSLTQLGT